MLDLGARSGDGAVQSHRIAYIDQQAGDDWELVLRETHHRMKNTLTLLGATVRRDFMRGGAKGLPGAIDRFERRLVAFGRLYHLLSSDAGPVEMPAGTYFESLSGALSAAMLEPIGVRCEAAIEDGALPSAHCLRLGLLITELVTNAAKHAFPNRNGGLIRVEVQRREQDWCCTVTDNGVGAIGSLQGTGGRVLERLARSIQAEIHVEASPGGTVATIVMPAW